MQKRSRGKIALRGSALPAPAFAGIVGEILAIDEACRMTVLIEMMQRSVKLQVTAEQVAPAVQR